MTWWWLALVGLAVCALGLGMALLRQRALTQQALAAARAETAELRARLERLEHPPREDEGLRVTMRDQQEYRITRVGEPDAGDDRPAPRTEPVQLDRAVFADLLLRESVIRVGSLAHGVRRALSPENRNRIRFEMRREVKRARKQRRADQRLAYREWQARQRAELSDEDLRETA
jgi:hypothetical protein